MKLYKVHNLIPIKKLSNWEPRKGDTIRLKVISHNFSSEKMEPSKEWMTYSKFSKEKKNYPSVLYAAKFSFKNGVNKDIPRWMKPENFLWADLSYKKY